MMVDFSRSQWQLGTALGLLTVAACKSFGGGGSTVPPGIQPNPPTVISCTPPNGSTGIPLNEVVSVTFSEAMNLATLNTNTFLLTYGPAATPVRGEIVCTNARAVFWPSTHFASNSLFTATITTGAMSATGVPLVTNHTWTFTTGSPASASLSGHSQAPGLRLQGAATARPQVVLSARSRLDSVLTDGRVSLQAASVFQSLSTPARVTEWVYGADLAPPVSTQPMLVRGDHQPAFAFRPASLRPTPQSHSLDQPEYAIPTTGSPYPFKPLTD